MREAATKISHKQPGIPLKLAEAIVRLAASPKPPVHLPLGNDTLHYYREKTAAFEKHITRKMTPEKANSHRSDLPLVCVGLARRHRSPLWPPAL
jgi:hypothetical protein